MFERVRVKERERESRERERETEREREGGSHPSPAKGERGRCVVAVSSFKSFRLEDRGAIEARPIKLAPEYYQKVWHFPTPKQAYMRLEHKGCPTS